VRDLGRHPDWSLAWVEGRSAPQGPTAEGELMRRLLAPPSPGDPGSSFIHPTMSIVDRTGLAADLLDDATAGLTPRAARRELLRLAAWSMLQDDPAHAPYGWSHCLTMPQAVLAVAHRAADPGRAVAVAATYVLGFRATLRATALDPAWIPPEPARPEPERLLLDGPDAAAARLWHAGPERPALVRAVVTYAAGHHDAHLAKYTLACLEAAADDPEAAPAFLAAAAYLAGWWRQADDRTGDEPQ
jgi:hypothetical protein